MTTKVNLKMNQGETYRHTLYWKDENDQPIDITGFTARMQVRAKTNSPEVLLELTTANGGVILSNPVAGELKLYVSATVTEAFSWIAGVYDLELIAPNDDVTRLIEGKITIIKEVTR